MHCGDLNGKAIQKRGEERGGAHIQRFPNVGGNCSRDTETQLDAQGLPVVLKYLRRLHLLPPQGHTDSGGEKGVR